MTQKEKELYDKIKNKTRQQLTRKIKGGIKDVFSDHHKKLRNYDKEKATMFGDWLSVIEQDIKRVL